MTIDQAISTGTSWAKKIAAIGLLIVVAAMVVEVFAKLIGVGVNLNVPAWSQQNALMIAAIAYALR